ncbi:MAG: cyclase family protein [Solirubrobacterales bacterium]|nr:cyclase family protein [Solirubrobacterales bacterium]
MPSRAPLASVNVSADDFSALFEELCTWRRWGFDDERGALNLLTAERVAAATRLVRDGITTTLSLPLNTQPAEHNPNPADHYMTALAAAIADADGTHFNKDYVGADYHNDGHTHIDALSHVAYGGSLYNGKPEAAVTEGGAHIDSIQVLKDGLVGRGVLLDVPRARGVPWLEPGEHIFREDLEAAEGGQGVRVGQGDVLLVRTGHARRLDDLGPWDTPHAKAGLHPTALGFLAERDVAVLGSDGNSDTAPSSTEGVAFPIHVLAITAMGIHLLDYLQFEDVREICQRTGRWEFLFVGAPLRIVGGTGSPLNPLAVF